MLTNNGLLTLHLTHPRYKHKKIYDVWVEGNPSIKTIDYWSKGVYIGTKKTKETANLEHAQLQNAKLENSKLENAKKQVRCTKGKYEI